MPLGYLSRQKTHICNRTTRFYSEMKKWIFPLVSMALLLWSEPVEAQNKSLLWKISGNGLPQESYLFGTIHIIPAKDYFLPKGTDSLLAISKRLVLEMDISDPSLQVKLMKAMLLDSGKTLADLYTAKEYAYLTKQLDKKFGIPVAALAGIKPILVQQSLMMKAMAGDDYKSYEKEFMAKAKENNIPLVGLETLEDQLSALDAMPLEEQADGLLKAVKNPGEAEKSLAGLIKKYRTQDVDLLYASISGKKAELKKYEQDLLINRNKNWIPKIAEMARQERIFIAVGAAHLGGDTGVINLLRQAGFTVEPVLTEN